MQKRAGIDLSLEQIIWIIIILLFFAAMAYFILKRIGVMFG